MQQIKITLTGKVVPKARPRFGNGKSYLPKNYRNWKSGAACHMMAILPPNFQPFKEAIVSIRFKGNHNRNADLDNLSGAILDALVEAEILIDDRLSVVQELHVYFESSKASPTTEISLRKVPVSVEK